MGNIETIISRIRNRRLELNLSYQDIADQIGLSKSTIQRYETGGIKKVPVNQIEDLAKALHVSPAYLMGWEQKSSVDLSKEDQFLLDIFHKLNNEGQKTAILTLRNLTFVPELSIISYEEAIKDALLNLLPGNKEHSKSIAKELRRQKNLAKSLERETKKIQPTPK